MSSQSNVIPESNLRAQGIAAAAFPAARLLYWSVRRELWENRMIYVAPVAVACVFLFGFSISILHLLVEMRAAPWLDVMQQHELLGQPYEFAEDLIMGTLIVVGFFYSIEALHGERRDRSILFWKSLPISDSMTVMSKLAMAAFVVPLITIIMATATSLLVLLMFCITLTFKGVNMFAPLFTTPTVYLTPLHIVSLLPVYVLWALPTMGWLMMVSSWARSKAFLWAVGVPLLSVMMLYWVARMFHLQWDIAWYAKNVIARILLGVLPGVWFPFTGVERGQLVAPDQISIGMSAISTQSWATLSNPELWIGVAAGAAMIYVAIRMRRWREE